MNEPTITVVGNLTSAPDLRFTPSGAAVANFTIAQTPRSFNKQTSEWEDGNPIFMDCSVWRDQAENVAESLRQGMRVIATGRLFSDTWEDKETGAKRSKMKMTVDEVGPALKFARAQVAKVQKGQQQGGQSGEFNQPPPQGGWNQPGWGGQPQGQPPAWGQPPQQGGDWGAPPPQQQGGWNQPPQQGGWGQPPQQAPQQGGAQTPSYDEPPF